MSEAFPCWSERHGSIVVSGKQNGYYKTLKKAGGPESTLVPGNPPPSNPWQAAMKKNTLLGWRSERTASEGDPHIGSARLHLQATENRLCASHDQTCPLEGQNFLRYLFGSSGYT